MFSASDLKLIQRIWSRSAVRSKPPIKAFPAPTTVLLAEEVARASDMASRRPGRCGLTRHDQTCKPRISCMACHNTELWQERALKRPYGPSYVCWKLLLIVEAYHA